MRPGEGLGLNQFRSKFLGPTKNNMVYECACQKVFCLGLLTFAKP